MTILKESWLLTVAHGMGQCESSIAEPDEVGSPRGVLCGGMSVKWGPFVCPHYGLEISEAQYPAKFQFLQK